MEKLKNSSVWTEQGYTLFARDGLDGIQIERLARILGLNKSGFYHYFGDLECFCNELISLHKKKVGDFLQEIADIKKMDPDYLYLLIKYSETVIFQMQLTRSQNNTFCEVREWADQKVEVAVRRIWSEFMEVPYDFDGGMRYYAIIRDVFYTRISFQNLNYTFLHNLVVEAKAIMSEISETKALEAHQSLY